MELHLAPKTSKTASESHGTCVNAANINIIYFIYILDSATDPCINVTACGHHGTYVNVNFNTRNINIIYFI